MRPKYVFFFYVQGFRKVDPDRWEFANEGFLAGQRHLLKTIKRRRVSQRHCRAGSEWPCHELGYSSVEPELERLRRSRSALMSEVVKLRQQQHEARGKIIAMEGRLQRTEGRQQQMLTFLAKAVHDPGFIRGLLQQDARGMRGICGAEGGRKRRLTGWPSFEDPRSEDQAVVEQGGNNTETGSETILEELLSEDLLKGDPEEEILVLDQPEANVEVDI